MNNCHRESISKFILHFVISSLEFGIWIIVTDKTDKTDKEAAILEKSLQCCQRLSASTIKSLGCQSFYILKVKL